MSRKPQVSVTRMSENNIPEADGEPTNAPIFNFNDKLKFNTNFVDNNLIANGYWLRNQTNKDGIPVDCVRAYQYLFNQGIGYFKNIIDDVIKSNGGAIQIPMQPQYLEQYLSGYTFEYRTFCNLYEINSQTEGFWRYDGLNATNIIIFYNRCALSGRQRFSQIHELIHFAQSVDPYFLDFIDELIFNSTLPEPVINKLLNRITERTTAMYLMPNESFYKKYQEIKVCNLSFGQRQWQELADAFGVSVQTAKYRLDECLRNPSPAFNNFEVMTT